MDAAQVCYRLLRAESEAEVQAIIESVPEMQNGQNWQALDKRETNFNVTSNQASDGGKALTELMTNMVDAVLMKAAAINKVDPRSKAAPQTMYAAVDKLIHNLHGGKLVNLDSNDPWLREFAQKNLVIGITGAKNRKEGLPCYTFVDNGEGQRAEDFENTFLSLSAGTKKSIPFVQGKFNMGSSGVLRYCGQRWFKLIVSRRYDGESGWAWTLLRRRPDEDDNMPIAEYFILGKTQIPSFDTDFLRPFQTMEKKIYEGVMLKTGTVVKLFDYQVGSKFLSFKGARETLNENLVETILPFRLLDFRQLAISKAGRENAAKRGGDRALGIDARPFYGMEFLLLRSHREDEIEDEDEDAVGETKISVGVIKDPDLGTITISAIPLKRTLPGWLKAPQNNNRVFHAVNGQVQFKQSRGYLSTTCGFPALKDRVIIIVDASNLSFKAHNELWKGDREHIAATIFGERYREKVTATIKESTELQALQKKIAQQELERASKAESNELFQKLVNADRNLAALLSERDPVIYVQASGGHHSGSESGRGEWDEGKYSPSFIRLEERHKKSDLEIPINSSRPVAARTDAQNGYLSRADNTGEGIIDEEVRKKFGIRYHLHDGRLTIYFEPLEDKVLVGDSFSFKIALKDAAMADVIESDELMLRVVDEQTVPKPKKDSDKKNHKHSDGDNNEGQGSNAPTRGLPKCILLTKDGREVDGYGVEPWPSDFNEYDGGLIEDFGAEGIVYKINYDNSYHLKYRIQQRGDVAREVVTEKYILGMRILMLGFEQALRRLEIREDNNEGMAEFYDDFRRRASRGAASTVLALAENLPKIVDRSSVTEDVE